MAVVAVAGAVSGIAAESSSRDVPVAELPQPTWAWRQVVQQRIEAQPAVVLTPKRNEELSPLLLHAAPDTDLVTLPPFNVNGARMETELKRQYAAQEKRAKEDAVMRRVGIGMHSVQKGHFGAGVLTVFHIPVFAGFGWSW
jgi:hypothetical protein